MIQRVFDRFVGDLKPGFSPQSYFKLESLLKSLPHAQFPVPPLLIPRPA
jgi:hypothetical protein